MSQWPQVRTTGEGAERAMHMTGHTGLFTIPSEHVPGLVVLIAFPLLWWAALRTGALAARRGHPGAVELRQRYRALPGAGRVALFALVLGAAVHAAIVPTHWGGARTTALLFIVDTVGMTAGAAWVFVQHRGWRTTSFAVLAGTAGGYGLYLVMHWETADMVGVATSAVELGAALVLLAPERTGAPTPVARTGWRAAGAMGLALCTMLGTVAIADSGSASASVPGSGGPQTPTTARSAVPGAPTASGAMSMGAAGGQPISLASSSPAGPIMWPPPAASMPAGMAMVPADCTNRPSAAQSEAAVALVDATVAATARFSNLAVAKAAGYVAITPTGARIVHYINRSVLAHATPLDPAAVPALVYVNTRRGAVLTAAMYLMPRRDGSTPPQPGGCLTVWHIHTDLCFSRGSVSGRASTGSCPAGQSHAVTQPMLHVWLAPVPGGPLAVDPGGVAEVMAASQLPPVDPPNANA